MNLLRKCLLGVILATGVVASTVVEVPQAKADIIFTGYGPYATLSIAEDVRLSLQNSGTYRSQFLNGPSGTGWYLVR